MEEDELREDIQEQENPQENPANPAHLPVSGEVNEENIPHEDPLTVDTGEFPDEPSDASDNPLRN